jgi:hypothetical protein
MEKPMLAMVTLINRLRSDENGASLSGQIVVLAVLIAAVIAFIAGIGQWYHH